MRGRVVDAGKRGLSVPAVGVLAIVYLDAGVEEGGAEGPEEGGEAGGLGGVSDGDMIRMGSEVWLTGSRSYTLIITSVFWSDRVCLWLLLLDLDFDIEEAGGVDGAIVR